MADKPVWIAISRAGNYDEGTPMASWTYQEPYFRTVLGFIGISNVQFIVHQQQFDPVANAAALESAIARAA